MMAKPTPFEANGSTTLAAARTPMRNRAAVVLAALLSAAGALAQPALAGKDTGPSGSCDAIEKASASWTRCIENRGEAALSDSELFYAGYWMAQSGRYAEAIGYLRRARQPDARTLTYLGFALRKSGDVDGAMRYYGQALAMAPDSVVTRAYLGEAHIMRGDMAAARRELAEIARRCGAGCAAYDDLARHIARAEG